MKHNGKFRILSIFLIGLITLSVVFLTPFSVSADENPTSFGEKESYVLCKDGGVEKLLGDGRIVKYGEASCIYIWISLMQLHEEGLINFDDPVSLIVPKDVYKEFRFTYDFTVQDLMNQSAGFSQVYTDRAALDTSSLASLEETLLNTVPSQLYKPGDYVAYSDWGNTFAAYIVECASGQSYPDYVKEHIFEPLSMKMTSVSYDLSSVPALTGIDNSENGVYNVFYPSDLTYGSVLDLAILLSDLTSGESLILSEESVSELFEATMNYRGTKKGRIAHGIPIYYEYENPVYGYRVYNSGNLLEFYISNDLKDYMIYATDDPYESERFVSLPYQIFGTVKNADNTAKTIGKMAGSYRKMSAVTYGKAKFTSVFDTVSFAKIDDGTLALSARKSVPYMKQISDNSFKVHDEDVGFFYQSNDGLSVIEFPLIDSVKVSRIGHIAKIALLIGYITGGIYGGIIIISAFFKFIARLINKTEKPKSKFRKYHLIQCGCLLLHVINFGMMALNILGGGSSSFVRATSFMFYIGSLISFVYLMFFAKTGIRDKDATNAQRIAYYITVLYSILFIAFAFVYGLLI